MSRDDITCGLLNKPVYEGESGLKGPEAELRVRSVQVQIPRILLTLTSLTPLHLTSLSNRSGTHLQSRGTSASTGNLWITECEDTAAKARGQGVFAAEGDFSVTLLMPQKPAASVSQRTRVRVMQNFGTVPMMLW